MSKIQEVASVKVSEPVSGLRRSRGKDKGPRRRPVPLDRHVQTDPRVLEAAGLAKRPGEMLRIISETEVWLVNKR